MTTCTFWSKSWNWAPPMNPKIAGLGHQHPANIRGTECKNTVRWCDIMSLQVSIKYTDYPAGSAQVSTRFHTFFVVPKLCQNKTWVKSWQWMIASISLSFSDFNYAELMGQKRWYDSYLLIPVRKPTDLTKEVSGNVLESFSTRVPHTLAHNYIIVKRFLGWIADGKVYRQG